MYRELKSVGDKYTVYKVGKVYEVESHRIPVFRGTEIEAERFIARHPYGLTKAKAEALRITQ